MKKIILMLAVVFTAGLTPNDLFAQSPKLGYVNSQQLVSLMPEKAQADSSLAKYMRKLDNDYRVIGMEGQKKLQEYQEQKDNWTEAVREAKERDLTNIQDRLQEFQMSAQDSIANQREKLYKPLLDKAQKAIENVAKEGGYDYIFDGSSLLYAKDSEDILPKVKTKLGIK